MADPWNPTGESFLRAGDVVLRGRSLNQQFERALAQERIQREQQDLLRRRLASAEARGAAGGHPKRGEGAAPPPAGSNLAAGRPGGARPSGGPKLKVELRPG